MKKDKDTSSFVNIGSSSLLIVFLVLCLATFATLSLSSAKSDYSLSEKLAAHKSQYYEASSQAEVILNEIDAILEETARTAGSSYIDAAAKALDGKQIEGSSLSCTLQGESLIISYTVPAEEEQTLDVELLVSDYTDSEFYYHIQKWQINSNDTWEGDNTLQLMPVGK